MVLVAATILGPTKAYADWFYTTDPSGELATKAYRKEGFEGYVTKSAGPGLIPIYRFYNSARDLHFYTPHADGEKAPGYAPDADLPVFYCSASKQKDTTALYRWFSPKDEGHFYTTAENGELAPSLGFQKEGVLCYVFTTEGKDRTKLFRWLKKGASTPQPNCIWHCEPDQSTGGNKCENRCRYH